MSESLKVLGQSAPNATTNTDIYTVGTNKAIVVSSIVVCNRGTSSGTFRIAVRVAGAVIATKHYLFYDAPLASKSTTSISVGMTLATTDVITVYASSADFSFNIFGSEVDV